jgi:hypothetical protein
MRVGGMSGGRRTGTGRTLDRLVRRRQAQHLGSHRSPLRALPGSGGAPAAAPAPDEESPQGRDRRRRADRDAFLVIEDRRRSLMEKLRGPDWMRPSRFRDLVLIMELIRLEYDHLAGRGGRPVRAIASRGQPAALGNESPAPWAQPWGAGVMYELDTAFGRYAPRRKRLARRIPAEAQEIAVAEAEAELDLICETAGIEIMPGKARERSDKRQAPASRPRSRRRIAFWTLLI